MKSLLSAKNRAGRYFANNSGSFTANARFGILIMKRSRLLANPVTAALLAIFKPKIRPSSSTPNVKIHLRSPLWPILAVLLLSVELVRPSHAWVILFVILGGAWLWAYLWARSLQHGLHFQRERHLGWARVGDRLQEQFSIRNTGWAPGLWLEMEDHSTLPGFSNSRITGVKGKDITRWEVEKVCTHRGLYTLGPTDLRTSDPLFIYNVEIHLPEFSALLVLPPVLPLPTFQIAPGNQTGDGHHAQRSELEVTVDAETVREYMPGDPLRIIHWPTSARQGTLYVRQFQHTPASDWWIFLDLESSSQSGKGEDSTEEHGIILAASLANHGLRQGHAVGLVTCGQELVWIPPKSSPTQLMEILHALALAQTGERSLSELLHMAHSSLQRGISLILITPDIKVDWIHPLLRLAKSKISPTTFLFDPVSFGGEGDTHQALALLDHHGITYNLIGRDLLDHIHTTGIVELPGQTSQGDAK
jgi:uncharacterized protein (DUF58 family)